MFFPPGPGEALTRRRCNFCGAGKFVKIVNNCEIVRKIVKLSLPPGPGEALTFRHQDTGATFEVKF